MAVDRHVPHGSRTTPRDSAAHLNAARRRPRGETPGRSHARERQPRVRAARPTTIRPHSDPPPSRAPDKHHPAHADGPSLLQIGGSRLRRGCRRLGASPKCRCGHAPARRRATELRGRTTSIAVRGAHSNGTSCASTMSVVQEARRCSRSPDRNYLRRVSRRRS